MVPALAGYESKMAARLKPELDKYCDSSYIDKIGNVIATIKGTDPAAPNVMVLAHMDNIGFFVKKIESNGYLRLERNRRASREDPSGAGRHRWQ